MRNSDLEIVLPELISVKKKLSLLTSLDPELFSVNKDDFEEHAKDLLHGIIELSKDINSDITAIKLQIEYVLKKWFSTAGIRGLFYLGLGTMSPK